MVEGNVWDGRHVALEPFLSPFPVWAFFFMLWYDVLHSWQQQRWQP